jgi:hypothetical protein
MIAQWLTVVNGIVDQNGGLREWSDPDRAVDCAWQARPSF